MRYVVHKLQVHIRGIHSADTLLNDIVRFMVIPLCSLLVRPCVVVSIKYISSLFSPCYQRKNSLINVNISQHRFLCISWKRSSLFESLKGILSHHKKHQALYYKCRMNNDIALLGYSTPFMWVFLSRFTKDCPSVFFCVYIPLKVGGL